MSGLDRTPQSPCSVSSRVCDTDADDFEPPPPVVAKEEPKNQWDDEDKEEDTTGVKEEGDAGKVIMSFLDIVSGACSWFFSKRCAGSRVSCLD